MKFSSKWGVWPVSGSLIGFALFYIFLAWGVSITTAPTPDKVIDLLGITVATFVAAWAGGWAAFNAERETQEQNRRSTRVSAANKAIFTIATAYLSSPACL